MFALKFFHFDMHFYGTHVDTRNANNNIVASRYRDELSDSSMLIFTLVSMA